MQCSLSAYGSGRNTPNYNFSIYVTSRPTGQSVSLSISIYYDDADYYWRIDRDSICFLVSKYPSTIYPVYDEYSIDTGELIYSKRQIDYSKLTNN